MIKTKITFVIFTLLLFSSSPVFAQDLGKIAEANFSAAKGQALYDSGRYEEAVGPLENAIKIRSEHGRAHYYLALTYEKLGKKDSAVNLLESYLDYVMHPNEEITSMDAEYVSKCMGLLGEMVAFDEIYKIGSQDIKARLYNMHGSRYYQEKKYDEAVESFKKVIEVRPQDALAHFSLAICYDQILNKRKEAIDLLDSYLGYIEKEKPNLSYTDLNKYIPQIKGLLKDLKESPAQETSKP